MPRLKPSPLNPSPLKSSPRPRPNALDTTFVPASNALLLIDFARERGADTAALLAKAGVGPQPLADDTQGLTVRQCTDLMALVQGATCVPALGYEMGLRTPGTAHGLYGLGILSSANPQEALQLAERFTQVRNPTFGVAWSAQGDWVTVSLLDLMPTAPMRHASVEWVLLSMVQMGETLMGPMTGNARAACELSFPWAQPPYHADYASRLPPCRFHATGATLRFPAPWLTRQLAGAAAASVSLARTSCERELALVAASGNVASRVRSLLSAGFAAGAYPSREAMAGMLSVSVSTLKRQLAFEGTRFSALLDEVRLGEAQRLLRHAALPVGDVAARLGYENTANFTRAFKQWSGLTPSAWRRSVGG